jgi:hypothetical protein
MDITKLKELEDLIALREPLEVDYLSKKTLYKEDQLNTLLSLIEERLVSEAFSITSITNGIKGTYLNADISAIRNLTETEEDPGLSVFIDVLFEGPLTQNYKVAASEAGGSGTVPDPPTPEEGQSELDISILTEQQLIAYYENFNEEELTPALFYSLQDIDAETITRFSSSEELITALFG